MMLLAIDYGTAIISAAIATGGFGLLAGGLSYWSAVRRQDKAVPTGDSNLSGEKPTDFWDMRFQALEDNARLISDHHDTVTREMQTRFETMVRGFNGKLSDVVVAINKMSTILDERLPRR